MDCEKNGTVSGMRQEIGQQGSGIKSKTSKDDAKRDRIPYDANQEESKTPPGNDTEGRPHADPKKSREITRGLWIQERALCQPKPFA
jgi:hypothetical protein